MNEIEHDGLGRRIIKQVKNSADLDCTYKYYHDGQRVIEERNGSDQVIKQHVWGALYIDELVQTGLNDDPTEDDTVDSFYYAVHDSMFNVIGLVDSTGILVERYSHTPYGQRTVYTSPGVNDPDCHAPILMSRRWQVGAVDQPYGLCDVGFQGLSHDEDTDLIHNRARVLHPRLGRFLQRDPLGYPDGLNSYAAYHVLHDGLDPAGREEWLPGGTFKDYQNAGWAGYNGHGLSQAQKEAFAAVIEMQEKAAAALKAKLAGFVEDGRRHMYAMCDKYTCPTCPSKEECKKEVDEILLRYSHAVDQLRSAEGNDSAHPGVIRCGECSGTVAQSMREKRDKTPFKCWRMSEAAHGLTTGSTHAFVMIGHRGAEGPELFLDPWDQHFNVSLKGYEAPNGDKLFPRVKTREQMKRRHLDEYNSQPVFSPMIDTPHPSKNQISIFVLGLKVTMERR